MRVVSGYPEKITIYWSKVPRKITITKRWVVLAFGVTKCRVVFFGRIKKATDGKNKFLNRWPFS